MVEQHPMTNRFDLTNNRFRQRTATTDHVFRQFNVVGATGSIVEAHLMGRLGLSGGIPNLVGCGLTESEVLQLCEPINKILVVMTESVGSDHGLGLIEKLRHCKGKQIKILYILQDNNFAPKIQDATIDSIVLATSFGTGIIANGLNEILAGRRYRDPAFQRILTERAQILLTRREQQVLQLLQMGMTNKEIATNLAISPVTIRDYVQSLMAKLGAINRTTVVVNAKNLGIL